MLHVFERCTRAVWPMGQSPHRQLEATSTWELCSTERGDETLRPHYMTRYVGSLMGSLCCIPAQLQVITTWHGHLSQLAEDSKPHLGMQAHHHLLSRCVYCAPLDTAIQAEATYVLQSISDLRGRSPQTPPTPILFHTLALLQHVTGDNRTALTYTQQAVDLCPQGDPLYPVLKSFLHQLSEAVSS